jgi:hypothetical protein
MSTSHDAPALESALASIPGQFRRRIIDSYLEIKRRYGEALFDSSFDAAGLSSGKFTESVFRFLQHHLTGTYIPFGQNIPNFADEIRKLIQVPATAGIESLRIIIPRALVFLYTLRGKRGIGHVGGDVEANSIDASTIVRVVDWIMCELIRAFHKLSLEEAQAIVDTLASRNYPEIWEVGGKKRVLRTDLDYKDKVLLLTYTDIQGGVMVEDLFDWTEHYDLSKFKARVLKPLHQTRLIEFDRESDFVFLSPLGVKEVEERILSSSLQSKLALGGAQKPKKK